MKVLPATFAALAVVGLTFTSLAAADPATSTETYNILNGSELLGDPAVGMLRIPSQGNALCSLTLVHPRFVLTARHCIQDAFGGRLTSEGELFVPEDFRVYFGFKPEADDYWYQVDDYRFHTEADLAVLRLTEAVMGVEPVPLNYQSLAAQIGRQVRIVGYGRTSSNGASTSGTKRFGYSEIERVTEIATLGKVVITGAPEAGGARVCSGDSGGPTFITINGVEYLAGVNSVVARFGESSSDGVPNQPVTCEDAEARNAEVRVDHYNAWINGAIAELDGGNYLLFGGCSASNDRGSSNGAPIWLFLVAVLLLRESFFHRVARDG